MLKYKNPKYQTQNAKIWTINFTNKKFVEMAKIIVPALQRRLKVRSMGIAIMLAVEYCQQEHILNDFLSFAETKKGVMQIGKK